MNKVAGMMFIAILSVSPYQSATAQGAGQCPTGMAVDGYDQELAQSCNNSFAIQDACSEASTAMHGECNEICFETGCVYESIDNSSNDAECGSNGSNFFFICTATGNCNCQEASE